MAPVGIPPELREEQRRRQNRLSEEDGYLALGLTSQQVGQWSSDHHDEAQQLVAWNYLGIIPICKVAARANISVFNDKKTPSAKNVRKSLRAQYGSSWKSFSNGQHTGEQLSQDHPLITILSNPNDWQSGAQYRWEAIQQLHLHGGALIWNAKNIVGKTVQRFVVPIALTSPISPGFYTDMPYGGIQVHPLTMIANITQGVVSPNTRFLAGRRIGVQDLTICRYPHPFLRGDGHSPTFAAKEWIDLSRHADVARKEQMKRGPLPRTLLTPPQDVMDSSDALDDWQRRMEDRLLNAKGSVVAIPHTAATTISNTPEEMEYNETFDQMGPAIMGMHGTGKLVAGMEEAMTFGAIAAGFKGFVEFTVQPDLDLLADEETQSIAREYGDNLCVEYEAPAFNNPEFEAEELEKKRLSGTLTVGWYLKAIGEELYGDERDKMMLGSQELAEWRSQPLPQQPGAVPGMPGIPGAAGAAPGVMPGLASSKPQAASGSTPPGLPPGFGQKQAESGFKVSPSAKLQQTTQMARHEPSDPRQKIERLARKKSWLSIRSDGAPFTVAVDLDGTIAQAGHYSTERIPPPREGALEAMHVLDRAGCGIIIFTCRDDRELVEDWLSLHGVPYDAINENPWFDDTSNKVFADVYWDDRAISARGEPSRGVAEIIDFVGNPEVKARLTKEVYGGEYGEQKGFLFFELADLLPEVKKIASQCDVIVEEEDEPHVTLIYGLLGVTGEEVAKACRPMAQFRIVFGETSVFEATAERKSDVLKVDIESEQLHSIFDSLTSQLPYIQTHRGYNPHMTIAYIPPGDGAKHAGMNALTGKTRMIKQLIYRSPGMDDVVIPLRRPEVPIDLGHVNGNRLAAAN